LTRSAAFAIPADIVEDIVSENSSRTAPSGSSVAMHATPHGKPRSLNCWPRRLT
jgi:hypothetical protein